MLALRKETISPLPPPPPPPPPSNRCTAAGAERTGGNWNSARQDPMQHPHQQNPHRLT